MEIYLSQSRNRKSRTFSQRVVKCKYFFSFPRTNVVIIQRYGRSLGFGFVSFNTLAEAEKAVLLDKRELAGRPINIEIARKKVPADPNAPKPTPKAKAPKKKTPKAEVC